MFMNLLWIAGGLVALVFGADLLVRGASRLALAFGITPLVVGLTVVAFGTSAPEMSVSLLSSQKGQVGVAIGNVIGSNIFNVLGILGICALIRPLKVDRQVIRLDVPIMIAAAFALLLLSLDGGLGRLDGVLLFGGVLAYTGWLVRASRKEAAANEEPSTPKRPLWANILLVLAGLGALVLGSQFLVRGAVALAAHYGVSELVVGLTIVAIGTSLPELATSAMASFRGESDIAVGNVVGSNIFNVLSVLGLSALVAPAALPISAQVRAGDLPIMIAVSLLCLPIFISGHRISRTEGGFFVAGYVGYTAWLLTGAGG